MILDSSQPPPTPKGEYLCTYDDLRYSPLGVGGGMMNRKPQVSAFRIILCFLSFYLLIACAQQQPLTGGNKDEVPPQINQELSTPNFQTNFTKQTIEFTFDEYIQLQSVTKQLVISPPLERLPKVTTKLRKLIFEFPEEEVLKENATYSINFGDAVKDLTEGNPVPNFKFIFS